MYRTEKTRDLVLKGIPESMRGELWLLFSGMYLFRLGVWVISKSVRVERILKILKSVVKRKTNVWSM